LVDIYKKIEGSYQLIEKDIEFCQYLNRLGFNVIKMTKEDQSRYGINFLNIGNGHIVSADEESASKISKAVPSCKIQFVDFNQMSRLYGSLHCSTQCISRECK